MKVALTGGTTGIGAAVAARLGRAGHEVTVFDITQPVHNADLWVPLDLSDPAAIQGALAQTDGPYDALINNAGLPPRDGMAHRVLAVNYFGLRAFLDGMLDRLSPGARIVNVASRAGSMWRDNLDEVKALMALEPSQLDGFIAARGIDPTRAYNLSKEAVIVMTMARTQEMLARGLSMNSVSPAAVNTDILQDFAAAFGDRMTRNVARAGRAGKPEEIADVIAFLAAPESGWIKGQDIAIDGGMGAMLTSDALGVQA